MRHALRAGSLPFLPCLLPALGPVTKPVMKLLSIALLSLASLFGAQRVIAPSLVASTQDPIVPGPQHELLQRNAGTWDAVLTTQGPDGKDAQSKGVMVSKKFTGYFVVEDFDAEFMGQKFMGHGVHGYCPVRGAYFTHWTDSMSPTPLNAQGQYDEKSKTLTLQGECLGMSGKMEPCRLVTKHVDADHQSFEMWMKGPDDKEMRVLRIDYTRRK